MYSLVSACSGVSGRKDRLFSMTKPRRVPGFCQGKCSFTKSGQLELLVKLLAVFAVRGAAFRVLHSAQGKELFHQGRREGSRLPLCLLHDLPRGLPHGLPSALPRVLFLGTKGTGTKGTTLSFPKLKNTLAFRRRLWYNPRLAHPCAAGYVQRHKSVRR